MANTSTKPHLNFVPPSQEAAEKAFKGLNFYFDTQYIDTDNIPSDRPVLYVSNHTRYSVSDFLPIFGAYKYGGRFVRALTDRMHFKLPGYSDLIMSAGLVLGDRDICVDLMKDRQSLFVFPGGAREALKKKSEDYQLVWKHRTGFVKLAIENDYDIVPVGVMGGEECFQVLLDADDYQSSVVGRWLDKRGLLDRYLRGKDELPPMVRGIGLSLFPKPQQIYVSYGKPIDLSAYKGRTEDGDAMLEAREKVADSILSALDRGREVRDARTEKAPLWRRVANSL